MSKGSQASPCLSGTRRLPSLVDRSSTALNTELY